MLDTGTLDSDTLDTETQESEMLNSGTLDTDTPYPGSLDSDTLNTLDTDTRTCALRRRAGFGRWDNICTGLLLIKAELTNFQIAFAVNSHSPQDPILVLKQVFRCPQARKDAS